MEMEEEVKKLPKIPAKLVLIVFVVLLVVGGAGGTYYFYRQYQKTKTLLADPGAVNKAETDAIVAKLEKLMTLPEGEEPSVATVLDVDKLKDQPFFAKATKGDKVVIYTTAKLAILYSPGKNLIINVAPVTSSEQTPKPTEKKTEEPAQKQKIKTALLNGTAAGGTTSTLETILKSKFSELDIISKTNAFKNDYQKSVVVDLTGSNTALVASISSAIKADMSSLPADETAPAGAELLIIVGENFNQ